MALQQTLAPDVTALSCWTCCLCFQWQMKCFSLFAGSLSASFFFIVVLLFGRVLTFLMSSQLSHQAGGRQKTNRMLLYFLLTAWCCRQSARALSAADRASTGALQVWIFWLACSLGWAWTARRSDFFPGQLKVNCHLCVLIRLQNKLHKFAGTESNVIYPMVFKFLESLLPVVSKV